MRDEAKRDVAVRVIRWIAMLICAVLVPATGAAQEACDSRPAIAVEFAWGAEPLELHRAYKVGDATAAVTRLDMLISDVALLDGETTSCTTLAEAHYLSAESPRCIPLRVAAGHAPRTLRFDVGLAPALNMRDPNLAAPGSALDPLENNLHWSWAGGYVFAALEGNVTAAAKTSPDGFLFHLGHERMRTRITLPVPDKSASLEGLVLVVDARALLDDSARGALFANSRQTHSSEGDPVADEMKRRLAGAFRLERRIK